MLFGIMRGNTASISISIVTRFFFTARSLNNFMVRPIIISGPSGGGKSTILARAMKEHPNKFKFSVSHTTRNPRDGEEDGVHYYFMSLEGMKKMIENNELFEHAEFGGNFYGTSKKEVEQIQKSGKICVLDVDLQGVRNFKTSNIDAKYILIKTPCIKILEERLWQRGTESEESLTKRIKAAEADLNAVSATPDLFHYVIINDNLDRAYAEFIDVISDELKEYEREHQQTENSFENVNGTIAN